MSNEITSILQPFAPQPRASARTPGEARGAFRPTVVEKSATAQGDRVSLTDSARLLQLAESKPGRIFAPRSDSSDVGMTYARTESSVQPASNRLPAQGNAQRPSPALANMVEAFLSTSDMESFDVNSDLNADGVINFQDLAALRAREIGAGAVPPETPKAQFHNMTEAFLSSEGSKDFDAASDLNDDGMINFQDLAILRAKIENSLHVDEKPLTSSD